MRMKSAANIHLLHNRHLPDDILNQIDVPCTEVLKIDEDSDTCGHSDGLTVLVKSEASPVQKAVDVLLWHAFLEIKHLPLPESKH